MVRSRGTPARRPRRGRRGDAGTAAGDGRGAAGRRRSRRACGHRTKRADHRTHTARWRRRHGRRRRAARSAAAARRPRGADRGPCPAEPGRGPESARRGHERRPGGQGSESRHRSEAVRGPPRRPARKPVAHAAPGPSPGARRLAPGAARTAGPAPATEGGAMDGIAERYDIPEHHFWLRGPRPDRPVAYDPATGIVERVRSRRGRRGPRRPGDVLLRHHAPDAPSLSPRRRSSRCEGFLTQLDPPEHGRLRRLVSSAFTRKVVADLEPRIAAPHPRAARRGARARPPGARRRPRLPAAGHRHRRAARRARRRPRRCSGAGPTRCCGGTPRSRCTSPPSSDRAELRATLGPWREMTAYLAAHAAERRRRPRADLLTRLVEAEVDGERLPDAQVVGFAILLLLAGHVTTTMLLGNTVLCLDAFPEQQDEGPGRPRPRPGRDRGVAPPAHPVRRRSAGPPPARPSSAARRSRPTRWSWCGSPRRTGTPGGSPTPTPSTPPATPTRISPSAAACTSASARRSPAWRAGSP